MIWDKIAVQLNQQDLTINQLAKLSGVHPSRIYDIRNGKSSHPSFELMDKISNGLGVSLDVFKSAGD
ncbi:helix-turn-helix transcriptional regulator [uncultured Weissella sp.]|uniref:helix-turn-helix domain-containing protein n=1 Tax=uncultured Weissella sp. TaxID=253243 RepID=UPI00259127D7|nr:helix-turn-helix transcriptional regulator [uncultured Weissella sp.]